MNLLPARRGGHTLQVACPDGSERILHSVYDPVAEAAGMVDAFAFPGEGMIVVLGLGLGYHLDELRRRHPHARIAVVEASPEIFSLCREHGKGTEPGGKVCFVTGASPADAAAEVSRLRNEAGQPPVFFFQLASETAAFPEYYGPVREALERPAPPAPANRNAPRAAERPDLWAPRRHPYHVHCPEYRETSTGVIALHLLCHALNLVGEEAWVTTEGKCPRLRTPTLTEEVRRDHRAAGVEPIVVYPEVVSGNPFGASVVARYILNKPGLLGGETAYPDSELLFCYSPEFLPPGMKAEPLTVPVFDLGLFRPGLPASERRGRYFYAARYRERGGVLFDETKDCIELSMREPRSLEELAVIFRTAEVLYSYERSALCTEAMVCGCPVVYLPNPILTEFPAEAQHGRDGAAWGADPGEIARAKATVGRKYLQMREMQQGFWADLDRFIAATQSAARDRVEAKRLPVKPA